MKRQTLKLRLHRETLRTLDAENLSAAGGFLPANGNTREISICYSCTKKIDSCPDATATIG